MRADGEVASRKFTARTPEAKRRGRKAVLVVARALERLGFCLHHSNKSDAGISLYYRYPGQPRWRLRVSDHRLGAKNMATFQDILMYVTLERPPEPEKVPSIALSVGIGFLARCAVMRGRNIKPNFGARRSRNSPEPTLPETPPNPENPTAAPTERHLADPAP